MTEQGVTFVLGEKVTGFKTENNQIKAVKTENQIIEGDEFVLASGAWTFELARTLGLNIPIQGGKGYSMNVARTTNITMPAILTEAKCAVTPMQGFTRFAGTMEFSGNTTTVQANRVEAIASAANRYYKDLSISEEEKGAAKSGLRPVSPDGLPFIGRTPKFKNLSIAAGHAMMGWSLGPITGKLITALICQQESILDLRPFAINRF